jgi:hypothetical protein
LGLAQPTAQKEYTPQELGLAPAQKEYTPEELGLAPTAKTAVEPSVTVQAAPDELGRYDASKQAPATPSIFQRVKDIAAAPIEAVMGKDVFKEGAQAPSPLKGSVKKGILNVEQSVIQNQLASLMDLQEADKYTYGANYEKAPADQLDKISARDKVITDKLRSVADLGLQRKAIENKEGVFELSKSLKDLYSTKEYKDSSFLDGLGMIGNKIAENPSGIPGWIAGVGIESLPQSMVTVAAALGARAGGMGPKGAVVVGGSGSSFMEFGSQYADLRAQGLSHEQAWEEAGVKSAIIGLFDAASFNAAGKSAGTVFKNIEKGALKETVKDVSKGVGIQALYGGAGEGLGSFAINQKVDPGAILEEMVGEVFGAPIEAVSTYQEKKAEAAGIPPAPETKFKRPEQEFLARTSPFALTEKQKQEALNFPPAEITIESTPEVEQFLKDAQTRYQEAGFSRTDAERLANEDAKEADYGNRLIPGASEPSVSVPTQQGEAVPSIDRAGRTSVDGISEPTGVAGDGTTVQSGALTPAQIKDISSPESQEVQSKASTMAHTLFNPNNVRSDGRPGWDQPPKERWPLIKAFQMGSKDVRGGFSHPEDYTDAKERQAYELGRKYAASLMAGSPIDVTNEAANLTTTTISIYYFLLCDHYRRIWNISMNRVVLFFCP